MFTGKPRQAVPGSEPIWMDPPARAGWVKVSAAPHWTKLDVIENNRVRFELFRRIAHDAITTPDLLPERHDVPPPTTATR